MRSNRQREDSRFSTRRYATGQPRWDGRRNQCPRRAERNWILLGLALTGANMALAQSPGTKCQAGKNTAAAKLASCMAKAEKKFVITGDGTTYGEAIAKCTDKFSKAWAKLEQKAVDSGGACTTTLDEAAVASFVDGCANAISSALAGNPLLGDPVDCAANRASCTTNLGTCGSSLSGCTSALAPCGSGTAIAADVKAGRTFSSMAGIGVAGTAAAGDNVSGAAGALTMTIPDGFYSGSKACTASDSDLTAANILLGTDIFGVVGTGRPSQRLKTDQTICYDGSVTIIPCAGTNQDGELQKGVSSSFTDNGDGTITDHRTGLMWQKLCDEDPAGVICRPESDVDTTYTWWTAVTQAIPALNSSSYAGYNDWRLPNVNELETLTRMNVTDPATVPALHSGCTAPCSLASCSCTAADMYTTATTAAAGADLALGIHFSLGSESLSQKTESKRIRAVRDAV